jgi:hypothetical protein
MALQPVRPGFLNPRLGLAFSFGFVSCLLDSLLMLVPSIRDHGLEIEIVGHDPDSSVWHTWGAWQARRGNRSSRPLGHVRLPSSNGMNAHIVQRKKQRSLTSTNSIKLDDNVRLTDAPR